MLSLCPDVGDTSFGHLVKVMSARSTYCRVTNLHLVINK